MPTVVQDNRPPSATVLDTVADATGTDVLDLPPLYDVIDPETLNRLLASDPSVRIEFQYADYRIVATGDGDVTVTPAE